MKIDFKKIVCFGLVVSFGCLSAQDAPSETSKEISMSRIEECPSPDECKMERCFQGPGSRTDKYDYDVYTQGEGCDEEERAPAPSRRNCDNECPSKKPSCGSQCKRKGAAKVAQE